MMENSDTQSGMNDAHNGQSFMSELKKRLTTDKMKSNGRKALSPLVDLVTKYEQDLTPYLKAMVEVMKCGVERLQRPLPEGHAKEAAARAQVAQWLETTGMAISDLHAKVESKNVEEILTYVEEEARKRPGLTFSASYFVGMLIGRVGRNLSSNKMSATSHESATAH